MLRAEHGAVEGDVAVEFDFDHVPAAHAAAFGEAVDEGFVEVDDEGLLAEVGR